MTSENDEFKDRLQLLIGERSISEFARKCKIGDTTLRKYLNGATPGLDKVILIADAANVELKWLATGKGPMRPGGKNSINQLEDPLIRDIKLWLRDMTADNPGWKTWFEVELTRKIPEFNEWRKKNQASDSDEKLAAS